MRTLIVMVSLAFLSLIARPARAQCCGEAIAYHVSCGEGCGGDFVLYSCDDSGDGTFFATAYAQCGSGAACQRIEEDIPSGSCDDGLIETLPTAKQDPASTNGEASFYVNAYVKDCRGRYVAVQMPMARQAG
jgi:hypothetical protein